MRFLLLLVLLGLILGVAWGSEKSLVWLHVRTMELANLGYVPPTPAPTPELKFNGASSGGKSKGGGDGKKPAAGADGVRRSEWEMRAVRGLIEKKVRSRFVRFFLQGGWWV